MCDALEEEESAIIEHVARSREVFRNDLSEEQLREILAADACFSAYYGNCPEKPKSLDFKAKKAFAKLVGYSFLSAPTFAETVNAVREYGEASRHERRVAATVEGMYKLFHRQLTAEQIRCVRLVIKKCSNGHKDACAFVHNITENFPFVSECYSYLKGKDEKITFGKLVACYDKAYRLELLRGRLEAFNAFVAVYSGGNEGKEAEIAQSVIGAWEFISACRRQNADNTDTVKAIAFLRGGGNRLKANISETVGLLSEFGKKHFRNYYVINGEDNSFGDLRILAGAADDRDVIAAAAAYTALKHNPANAF
ncbi:MAG: hypothetical protein K2L72_00355, partial [Clostridia bacterium]|nr:hypothetical protein [Clostridia bacterium]